MFTKRLTQPSKTLTAVIVFTGGIISGAALAAGQQPQDVRNAMAMWNDPVATVAQVDTPTLPAQTASPQARAVEAVEAPKRVPVIAGPEASNPVASEPNTRQAVTRQDTTRETSPAATTPLSFLRQESATAEAAPPAAETVDTVEAPSSMADKASFLLIILLAMMGGAALLAHRRQIGSAGADADLTLEVARSIRLGPKLQLSLVRVPGRLLVVGATDKGVELLTELFSDDEETLDDDFLASALSGRQESAERGHQALSQEELLPEPIMTPRREPIAPAPAPQARVERPRTPRKSTEVQVGKRTVVDSVGAYSRPAKRQTREHTLPAAPSRRAPKTGEHDDAFLDSMLERLSNARPAVAQRSPNQVTKTDERAALRAQVKQYRRGPTRL